jgi:hypothetical protein
VIYLELVVLLAVVVCDQRRPVLLAAKSPAPPVVRVIYDVSDGAPRAWWPWSRRYDVPVAGTIYSQFSRDAGWYRPGNPHPVEAVVDRGGDQFLALPAVWVRGGTTTAGSCNIAYDEYALGDESTGSATGELPLKAWLDSLPAWGIDCRDGLLYRTPPAQASSLKRTGPTCYYDRAGAMTCEIGSDTP